MSAWPFWLLALVDALAVHRLVRLVTEDVIATRPRRAIIRWAYLRAAVLTDDELDGDLEAMVEADMVEDPCDVPRPAVLIVCRWCASIWLAAGAVLLHSTVPAVWLPLAGLLALSSASTLLAGLED